MIESSLLAALPHVAHGFFTREGGTSGGIYASLNSGPGSKDDPTHVRKNRARVAQAMDVPPENLLTLYQVHSPDTAIVTEPFTPETRPEADSMAADTPGLALGILTADCVPVLFADKTAPIIGAAHSGWKGAIGGVLESTIAAMEELGANRANITAAIGPAISQTNYEVGAEFRDTFLKDAKDNARWFVPSDKPDHFRFDLPGYVEEKLRALGLGGIDPLGLCTYADEKRFFSFRRATHRGEPDYGRQVSVIRLKRT